MRTIPEEIMTNILFRLPAKCIGRSRCVSKPWRRLLSELHFIKDHLEITKKGMDNELLIFISETSNTLFSASITHHSLGEIIALATELSFVVSPEFYTQGMPSCDGLILIEDGRDKRLLVNPITRGVRELPVSPYALPPRGSFTMYGLGYDHVNDDYKIVTLSYYDGDNEYESDSDDFFVNVYSVRNGTWKQVEGSSYDHAVGSCTSGVYVNGSIHWLAGTGAVYSSVIVGYDLSEEKFHEVPAPSALDGESFVLSRLTVLGGCLAIYPARQKVETHVWVMKEYGVKQSWTKISIVDPTNSEYRPLIFMSGQREVVTVKDEETVAEKVEMYDLDDATFKDITIHGANEGVHIGGSFIETLVSPYYNHETPRI